MKEKGYDGDKYKGNIDFEINHDTGFPTDFWIWKTGWSYEKFDQIVEVIENKSNYAVELKADHDAQGQLAHIYKVEEIN